MNNVIFFTGSLIVRHKLKVDRLYQIMKDDAMHDLENETPDVVVWRDIKMVVDDLDIGTLYVMPEAELKCFGSEQIIHMEYLGLPADDQTILHRIGEKIWWASYNIVIVLKPNHVSLRGR